MKATAISLPDSAPLTIARAFVRDGYQDRLMRSTLRHWRAQFYCYDADTGAYVIVVREVLRSAMWKFMEGLQVPDGEDGEVTYSPNKRRVDDAMDAAAALCQAHVDRMPAWLESGRPDPSQVIAFSNGILDLSGIAQGKHPTIAPPSLAWFSTNVIPFPYVEEPPEPEHWLAFLRSLWPDDPACIDLLQEWFGYSLTGDTSQQKMLLLVGPPRSGKGTIARVLRAMIGEANVCGPTLSGLSGNFGLWGLIGKLVAIVSDARLGGRADKGIVTERLLAVSGEDAIEVHRKNLEPVTLRLPTRFVIISNELPRLDDASGALANRFVALTLTQSFLGREDVGLTDRLLRELPGILWWAIMGLRRLKARGRFITPQSSADAMEELDELTSPIRAFIKECCEVGTGKTVDVQDLYRVWCAWCKREGRDHPGTVATFGRDLRAAVPVVARQRREAGDVVRKYEGINLTLEARVSLDVTRDIP